MIVLGVLSKLAKEAMAMDLIIQGRQNGLGAAPYLHFRDEGSVGKYIHQTGGR
jgi:hypothetical protein